MYDWRGVNDRQLRQRWNQAKALGSTVTNTLYYRYTSSSFGAPYSFGESWTFTEQVDSSNDLGDSTTSGITETVDSKTQSVTVHAGTFTCYTITITNTKSGNTIIEYWDAQGRFPYAPVEIVDSDSFSDPQTSQLYSSTALP